jgi:transposase-like protein
MTWQPKKLTREQMAERRAEGVQLLQAGEMTQAQIARELGVSEAAVSRWKKKLAEGGPQALQARVLIAWEISWWPVGRTRAHRPRYDLVRSEHWKTIRARKKAKKEDKQTKRGRPKKVRDHAHAWRLEW